MTGLASSAGPSAVAGAHTGTGAPPGPTGRTGRLGWLYIIAGLIGLVASATLLVEHIASLRDPEYVATCSINPVIACGSVMDSPQATLFGFPNTLLGITGFAGVLACGAALAAGFRPPRWFRLGMLTGTALGGVFVHWLIYHSLYTIGALCPYCMVVWAVTIPLLWYTALHAARREFPGSALVAGAARLHTALLAAWFLAIFGLITQAFWSYWVTVL